MNYTLFVKTVELRTSLTQWDTVCKITLDECDFLISKLSENKSVLELVVKDEQGKVLRHWDNISKFKISA